MSVILALWRQKQKGCCKFRASLINIGSSRPHRAGYTGRGWEDRKGRRKKMIHPNPEKLNA